MSTVLQVLEERGPTFLESQGFAAPPMLRLYGPDLLGARPICGLRRSDRGMQGCTRWGFLTMRVLFRHFLACHCGSGW